TFRSSSSRRRTTTAARTSAAAVRTATPRTPRRAGDIPARRGHERAVAPYPLNRLDDLVGETIERILRAHHARRLRRHGSAEAIDPPPDGGWARTASFAPRSGCRVEPFLDGAEARPRIAEAIRSARPHVHLAGWHFDAYVRLDQDGPTHAAT